MGKNAKDKGQAGRDKEDTSGEHRSDVKDRIAYVRPYWRQLTDAEKQDFLTIAVSDLEKRAEVEASQQSKRNARSPEIIDCQLDAEEELEFGLQRLRDGWTWKVWTLYDETEFDDIEDFRDCMYDCIDCDLLDARPPEITKGSAAAAARLRDHISTLLHKTQYLTDKLQDLSTGKHAQALRVPGHVNEVIKATHIELIMTILTDLEDSYPHLYHSLAYSLQSAVYELLDANEYVKAGYCILRELSNEVLARFSKWLRSRLQDFSADTSRDEGDNDNDDDEIKDIDEFALVEHSVKGECLTVRPEWLKYLKGLQLDRKGAAERPESNSESSSSGDMGLVLEWIYGLVLNEAAAARRNAQQILGKYSTDSSDWIDEVMEYALKIQQDWQDSRSTARALAKEMLLSRIKLRDHSEMYPGLYMTETCKEDQMAPSDSLPDDIVHFMLERESILTKAKLLVLQFEKQKCIYESRDLNNLTDEVRYRFDLLRSESGKATHYRQTARARARAEEAIRSEIKAGEFGTKLMTLVEGQEKVKKKTERKKAEEATIQDYLKNIVDLLDRFKDCMEAAEPQNKKSPSKAQLVRKLLTGPDDGSKGHAEAVQPSATSPSNTLQEASAAKRDGDGDGSEAAVGDEPPRGSKSDSACKQDDSDEVHGNIGPQTGSAPETSREGGEASTTISNARVLPDAKTASAENRRKKAARKRSSLNRCRNEFQVLRPKFIGEADDKLFLATITSQIKGRDKLIEDGWEALRLLEKQMVDVACDDPGETIGGLLMLPLLRERLFQAAYKPAQTQAVTAALDIIYLEDETSQKEHKKQRRKEQRKQAAGKKAQKKQEHVKKSSAPHDLSDNKTADQENDSSEESEESSVELEIEEIDGNALTEQIAVLRKARNQARRKDQEDEAVEHGTLQEPVCKSPESAWVASENELVSADELGKVPGDQSWSERQDNDRSSVKSVDGIEGSFFWPMQMPPSQTAKPAVKVTSKQETAWHRPVRPKPPQTIA